MVRAAEWLLLLHLLIVQIFYYFHYLRKWLVTENTIRFVENLFK